ncbi:MAG: sugar ABC transporter ATP-binding protein [Verrucomicrobia bacterium]|nr:sugar ABC transporter ATP-binding protein [Verrucomicrobiota bacterium]
MSFLFQTEKLSKAYAGPVLRDVDFTLCPGEVHALVGENGAGKSTLCQIVAGIRQPDSGRMLLEGKPFAPLTRKDAEASGIRIVLQELNLIETLTIAENLFLEQLPNRAGWIKNAALEKAATQALTMVGMQRLPPGILVSRLGIGQKQLVEIAAGMSHRCRVLILDEPTAALTAIDTERLFERIQHFKAEKVGIIFISHHLEEVEAIADRVSVLRDGELVACLHQGEYQLDEVIRLMVGRKLDQSFHAKRAIGKRVLRVEGLQAPPAVREVSFDLSEGEILGFAGLMGSGRTETVRAIFGADQRAAGKIYVGQSNAPARIERPSDAVRLGIGLLTEDRKTQGLLLPKPARVNITLANLGSELLRFGGWLDRDKEASISAKWVQRLDIKVRNVEQTAVSLSGGNQQKLLLARWLYRDCKVLICDEPTRGIDVGAKFEIYRFLNSLAEAGKGVIVISSDLKELLQICDRIAVLSAGKLAKIFRREEWSEDKIMSAAFSEFGAGKVAA